MRAQSILRAINVTRLLIPAVQGRTSKLIVIRSNDPWMLFWWLRCDALENLMASKFNKGQETTSVPGTLVYLGGVSFYRLLLLMFLHFGMCRSAAASLNLRLQWGHWKQSFDWILGYLEFTCRLEFHLSLLTIYPLMVYSYYAYLDIIWCVHGRRRGEVGQLSPGR